MRADADPVLSGSCESSLDRAELGDRDGGDAFCRGEAESWSGEAAVVTPYSSSSISSAIVFGRSIQSRLQFTLGAQRDSYQHA